MSENNTTQTKKNNLDRKTLIKMIIIGAVVVLILIMISTIWGCSAKVSSIIAEEEANGTGADGNGDGAIAGTAGSTGMTGAGLVNYEIDWANDESSVIYQITLNSEAYLPYANLEGADVSYYVDNSHIAIVDEYGWVVSSNYGETTVHITVTDENGNTEQYDQILMIGTEEMAIQLFPSVMVIDQDEVSYCVAYVYDDYGNDISGRANVTYTSSDPSIAYVDLTGQVTGVNPGVTTVVVTATLGNHVSQASMAVSVNGPHEEEQSSSSSYHTHYLTLDTAGSDDCSCTKAGTVRYSCTCGYSITQTVAALGHNYESKEVVQPTCTQAGYAVYECTRCGDSYKKNTGEARGHGYQQGTHVSASCTGGGYTDYYCVNCNDTYRADEGPLGHSYDKSNPDGSYTSHTCRCTRCGDTYTEGHSFPNGGSPQGQTCTECHWFHPIL